MNYFKKNSLFNYKKKTNKNRRNVKFDKENIIFYKLNHHKVVSDFIRGMKSAIKYGFKKFNVDFSYVDVQVFPNVVVPLSALFEYYESQGYEFIYKKMPRFFEGMNFPTPQKYKGNGGILNKVWEFSSEDIGAVVDAFIEEIGRCDTYPIGFLTATEWALTEVMDNVIQHSNSPNGFVMGQVHPTTKHVAITVFDMGCGIFNSFKNSNHHPRNAVDAITLALQESITRDKSIGQGNGLFGLSSLIKQGDSRLKITSGRGYYSYTYGNSITYENCPVISNEINMTTVDFMLDYSTAVSFEKALVFNGSIYTPITLRIENMEDIDGNIYINIRKESNGTGTRQAASQIKNKIFNILKEEPKIIILDFTGISVISSSYADELLAKLFSSLGLFQFNRVIKMIGLTDEQQLILQKSVIQRIIEDSKTISIT